MHYYNPGLKWFLDTGGLYFENPLRNVLHRVFWSFAQTEHAFKYYRLVVLVDGTFLTKKYRGTLMMATTVDPEDQIVSMALPWQRERTMNHGHGSCGFYVYKCLAHLALYV
jgi:hypothetical protein